MRTALKGAAAPIAFAVAFAATPVLAQEAADEAVPVPANSATAAGDDVITVTGSRIRRTEATSSSPLQIIDTDLARQLGANDTAEIVQNSPISNGSSQITSVISANAVANGGQGVQTVSLRGLGASRTLVLLNGRRAGPAGTRGSVSAFDLNVIPSSIVGGVEILKDGASSIYGSDAVAGVVNIQTVRDTDGIKFDFFGSVPFQQGGEEWSASAAWGKEFDRGHILVAAEYYRQNELERRDRDYLDCQADYVFTDETYTERTDLIDPRTGDYQCNGTAWGHIWGYFASNTPPVPEVPYTLFQYDYDNNLGQFIQPAGPAVNPFDIDAPAGWYPVGRDDRVSSGLTNSYSPFEAKDSVSPQTDRYTLYLDASYELADGIELYTEGLFNRRSTYVDSHRQIYNFGYTGQYAPGDPDDPFPGWGSAPGAVAYLSPTGIIDSYDQDITVDYYRAVVGVTGELASNVFFDVHGQWSRSDGDYRLQQVLNDSIQQQTDRAYGYGCAGLVTPISNRECVQINWVDPQFMAGYLTPEEYNYLIEWETGNTLYTQKFVEASLSTELFDLPGGRVGLAGGGVYREDSIDDQPGHITNAVRPGGDPNDPDDIIDNAFQNGFSSKRTFGTQTTKELFAEIELPLLADIPFIQSFTLGGAARVTNVGARRGFDGATYNTNGNWTYKGTANWQVNDWVRLRGTYGTSFRAPALFEQFLQGQVSGARQNTIDPCVNIANGLATQAITQLQYDNCVADGFPLNHTGSGLQAQVFTSGGFGVLEPEKSRAWTASLILTPDIGANTDLALTVDYFDIHVEGEIRRLSARDIIYGCYNSEDFPNNPLCAQFERGQDGNPLNIKSVRNGYINVDSQDNRGFDFTLRFAQDFGDAGRLTVLGQATLQTKDAVFDVTSTLDPNQNGDVGDPRFTADLKVGYEIENWSFLYGLSFIGKASSVDRLIESAGEVCNTTPLIVRIYGLAPCSKPFVPAVAYHSFSLTTTIQDNFELTVGMSNIFDKEPPEVSGVTRLGNTPFVSQYDLIGRRMFVRFGVDF
nr:TonB-dependent receptor [Alteraurantiacibacter buctensis]